MFETLERRMLLSGNVIAKVVDGVLRIRGDDADNQIRVEARADAIHVIGEGQTRVNGQTEASLGPVTRGARIRGQDGPDALTLRRCTFQ